MLGFGGGGSGDSRESFWTSLFLFGFGVSVLAFLIVIDRQEWMSARPGSGAAIAMAYASRAAAIR